MKIHRKLNRTHLFKNKLKKIRDGKKTSDEHKEKAIKHLSYCSKRLKKLKEQLYIEFTNHVGMRNLNESYIRDKNIISVFDSVLTRTLGVPINTVSKDIFVVQTYFFDILKEIILNGFIYNNEKYICFTASAGQIRTKKTVFIKESVWDQHQKSLMCGLSVHQINELGGVNINKFLAYLALCNSSTDEWKDFNIDEAVVVEDMETLVTSTVDFIDESTFEITRKQMDIPINHTDGCGMILPSLSKKSFMIRLPWTKGLLVPFNFKKFAIENKSTKIKDIYGKEYDILNDKIKIIFTKSQFKMWKYYKSWDDYKENFKKYNCQAGICNVEEDNIGNAKLNYQMLQTLNEMTDVELDHLSMHTKTNILNIGKDRKTMLEVLGVKDTNPNKNYIQQALEIYPELLNDTYSKEILKQVKKSMVKNARAGKLDVKGKYTFICPDLYAFCEYLFLNNKQPQGLLKNGNVYCKLYKDVSKLDCLRSPHLYREHAVRKNVVDSEKSKWFVTNGLYTSVHDPISKILMFDNDGDKSLVVADEVLVECAERHMEGIVPLQYDMKKAMPEMIDNQSVYDGLNAAYTGGNIGEISNDITKIWNSSDININVVKWLCMLNNYVIDYAKTLYKLQKPDDKDKIIRKYTKGKTPHFFIYAKKKEVKNVEKISSSVVNRLEKIIPNPTISFKKAMLGKFDYRMLLSDLNVNVEVCEEIIDVYEQEDLKRHFMINIDNEKANNFSFIYQNIKNRLLGLGYEKEAVIDCLIEHLYKNKRSSFKTTVWECFGDEIVLNLSKNIKSTLEESIPCDTCGKRIQNNSNRSKYCESCWKERQRELWRNNKKKSRNVLV